MKRVDIKYGGGEYSIGGRHIDDVQAEMIARLLITPGAAFSLIGINEPDEEEL